MDLQSIMGESTGLSLILTCEDEPFDDCRVKIEESERDDHKNLQNGLQERQEKPQNDLQLKSIQQKLLISQRQDSRGHSSTRMDKKYIVSILKEKEFPQPTVSLVNIQEESESEDHQKVQDYLQESQENPQDKLQKLPDGQEKTRNNFQVIQDSHRNAHYYQEKLQETRHSKQYTVSILEEQQLLQSVVYVYQQDRRPSPAMTVNKKDQLIPLTSECCNKLDQSPPSASAYKRKRHAQSAMSISHKKQSPQPTIDSQLEQSCCMDDLGHLNKHRQNIVTNTNSIETLRNKLETYGNVTVVNKVEKQNNPCIFMPGRGYTSVSIKQAGHCPKIQGTYKRDHDLQDLHKSKIRKRCRTRRYLESLNCKEDILQHDHGYNMLLNFLGSVVQIEHSYCMLPAEKMNDSMTDDNNMEVGFSDDSNDSSDIVIEESQHSTRKPTKKKMYKCSIAYCKKEYKDWFACRKHMLYHASRSTGLCICGGCRQDLGELQCKSLYLCELQCQTCNQLFEQRIERSSPFLKTGLGFICPCCKSKNRSATLKIVKHFTHATIHGSITYICSKDDQCKSTFQNRNLVAKHESKHAEVTGVTK